MRPNNPLPNPLRGEIWWVNFDPTVGVEIQKCRPAVVISSNSIGTLPLRIVAPLTDWKEQFSQKIWHIRLEPNRINGIEKTSSVDAFQVRSMDLRRFASRIGRVSAEQLDDIVAAVASVIEFQ